MFRFPFPKTRLFEYTILFAAMFSTGLASMLYEVVLISVISTVLGVTESSTSIVIAAFLLGLSIGAMIGGWISRLAIPLITLFFGIELVIAGFGFSFLWFIAQIKSLHLSTLVMQGGVGTLGGPLIFALLMALLLIPTMLMGMEIPIAVKIINRKKEDAGRDAGFVYSADTFGGVIGAFGAGLILIPVLGYQGAMFFGGLLNLVTSLMVLQLRKRNVVLIALAVLLLGGGLVYLGHDRARIQALQLDFLDIIYDLDPIYSENTPFQHIAIIDYDPYGNALLLDGRLQITEGEAELYHEYLVLPALASHGAVKRALVIGGGDGGALYQLLQQNISEVEHIELDARVINVSLKYLESVHRGSLVDPRVKRTIMDGRQFLTAAKPDSYDLIIIDLPDPTKPAIASLYTKEFYDLVKKALSPDGVMATQATTPYYYPEAFASIYKTVSEVFPHVNGYAVPSSAFSSLGYVLASDETDVSKTALDIVGDWYTSADHDALLALPPRLSRLIESEKVDVATDSNPAVYLYMQPGYFASGILDPEQ